MRDKKMIVIYIICFIFILVVFTKLVLDKKNNYIDDTSSFKEVYMKYGDYLKEKDKTLDMKKRFGKFSTEYDVEELVKEDNGVEYVFAISDNDVYINNHLLYVAVKSNEYVFGKQKVSVGNSKEKIEKIFKNSRRPKPDKGKMAFYDCDKEVVADVEEYCNDDASFTVGFVFDEKDYVKVIYLGPGPNI